MNRLFRYSGNKSKLLKFYRPPPKGVSRIVEPYLGSGAYSLNHSLPCLGFEINGELAAMWQWLKRATPDELFALNDTVEEHKRKKEKPDVRDMKLEIGPQTYVRVNVTGLVVGQLSSWGVYPQHSLPILETIRCLPHLKRFEVFNLNGDDHRPFDGDMLFVDPPYTGTSGNYIDKSGLAKTIETGYNPLNTIRLIERVRCPVIFTYGSNAREVFPDYEWKFVKSAKVPNMRRGGTVERTEWVAYINWPSETGTLEGVME